MFFLASVSNRSAVKVTKSLLNMSVYEIDLFPIVLIVYALLNGIVLKIVIRSS